MTYYMNLLQSLPLKKSVFVTLNEPEKIDQDKILVRKEYEHPFYNRAMLDSQKRCDEISGKNRIHYAGAYWGNGFHEDGVQSGLRSMQGNRGGGVLSHFYEGKVSHSRITPRHALEYRVWFVYLNLDEVEEFCKLSNMQL